MGDLLDESNDWTTAIKGHKVFKNKAVERKEKLNFTLKYSFLLRNAKE